MGTTRITKLASGAGQALSSIAGLLLLAAGLVGLVNVIARKVLASPIHWSDEFVGVLNALAVFFPFLLLEIKGDHLRVSAFYDLIPLGWRWIVDALQHLVISIVLLYCADIGLEVVRVNLEVGIRTPSLGLPMGYLYAVIPLAYVLGALGRALLLVELIWLGRRRSSSLRG